MFVVNSKLITAVLLMFHDDVFSVEISESEGEGWVRLATIAGFTSATTIIR
jgi:hypothetical protein